MTTKQIKYLSFLESIRTDENSSQVSYLQETFILTEAFRLPDIKNSIKQAIDNRKNAMGAVSTQGLSDEEVTNRQKAFKKDSGIAARTRGLVSGYMHQIEKYAMKEPLAVEEWIDNIMLPAIKTAKQDMDRKLGTDSSSRSVIDRTKRAIQSFVM
jgi:hypothetical protein